MENHVEPQEKFDVENGQIMKSQCEINPCEISMFHPGWLRTGFPRLGLFG